MHRRSLDRSFQARSICDSWFILLEFPFHTSSALNKVVSLHGNLIFYCQMVGKVNVSRLTSITFHAMTVLAKGDCWSRRPSRSLSTLPLSNTAYFSAPTYKTSMIRIYHSSALNPILSKSSSFPSSCFKWYDCTDSGSSTPRKPASVQNWIRLMSLHHEMMSNRFTNSISRLCVLLCSRKLLHRQYVCDSRDRSHWSLTNYSMDAFLKSWTTRYLSHIRHHQHSLAALISRRQTGVIELQVTQFDADASQRQDVRGNRDARPAA